MKMLFYAHSGLRYLVLLMGLAAVAYFAYGLASKRPVDKSVRILGSSFAGLLDTQILLANVGLGVGLVGLGVAVVSTILENAKKGPQPSAKPSVLTLTGTAGSLRGTF